MWDESTYSIFVPISLPRRMHFFCFAQPTCKVLLLLLFSLTAIFTREMNLQALSVVIHSLNTLIDLAHLRAPPIDKSLPFAGYRIGFLYDHSLHWSMSLVIIHGIVLIRRREIKWYCWWCNYRRDLRWQLQCMQLIGLRCRSRWTTRWSTKTDRRSMVRVNNRVTARSNEMCY